MLTKKQYELLKFIERRLSESSVSPSFDEMKEALGLKSKSGIHRLISGLEERGFIRRLPHRARALEILKLPAELQRNAPRPDASSDVDTNFKPNVIEGHFGRRDSAFDAPPATDGVQLPLYGKIAAGTPIEALRDNAHHIDVPPSMIGPGDHYALEVEGDSMIEAGIQDGDTVIIRRCANADNGTIVVAMVDESEVTLKRLRKRGDSIALEPANAAYKTRICGPDQVRVQGELVGLMRQY
ncbi:MAG: transcriptional repressor LexA [Rhodospirillales bacterium]|jgi:repressor LexA|nr:transcriptional repressor LexA [Rhodospirillales bacterium]MBT4625091.1 transcriptional repressor LexA [Rhodospirillales bacterium]MBT5352974.1 transcriptional repressor LexA [Rhodospirillales bacterium]MBT5519729.1 transcriptional repressor LexA [Rhodospirillales bacterium]MBT6109016.1 transcriptional repressor LexA [Rhodospirillales bacterium]